MHELSRPSLGRLEKTAGVWIQEVGYAPHYHQAVHWHSLGSITLLLRGEIDERVGSRLAQGRAMSVVVKPPGVEHQDQVGRCGASTLQMTLSPKIESELAEVHPPSWKWNWLAGGRLAVAMTSLMVALRIESARSDGLDGAVYDVLGAIRNGGLRTSRGAPTWLQRCREALKDQLVGPPSVRDLARDAGLHPVSLARIHRAHYGESLTEALRMFRVTEATRLLVDTSAPLSQVAYSTGFSDQSHFTRVYRATTGFTPGRVRRALTK